MPPPESESSIPLPGVLPITIPSSPPPFESSPSFEEMDTQGETHKPDPASLDQPADPRPPIIRADSGETERPPSAQRANADAPDPANVDEEAQLDDDDGDDDDADPAEKIPTFDWANLEERYHDAINQCSDEEAELMLEWKQLMDVPLPLLPQSATSAANPRASSSRYGPKRGITTRPIAPSHGTPRLPFHLPRLCYIILMHAATRRLRTRMAYVENSENRLEKMRQHCKPALPHSPRNTHNR